MSDPLGLNPEHYVTPLYLTSTAFINLPASSKEALTLFYTTAQLNSMFVPPDNPTLNPPSPTLNSFINSLMTAVNGFSQQLPVSALTDVNSTIRTNHLGNVLGQAFQNYNSLVQLKTEQTQITASLLTQQIEATNQLGNAQASVIESAIQDINSGASPQQFYAVNLQALYSVFQGIVIGLGGIPDPDHPGDYLLPANISQQNLTLYNAEAQNYQIQVSAFNQGISDRYDALTSYNNQANNYNAQATTNNTNVLAILSANELTTDDVPLQPLAELAIQSATLLQNPEPTTNLASISYTSPIRISIGTPPSWVNDLANDGAPLVPDLASYPLLDQPQIDAINQSISDVLYARVVNPLIPIYNGSLEEAQTYQAYCKNLPPLAVISQNPLLNSKPFLHKIFSMGHGGPSHASGQTVTQGANAISSFMNDEGAAHSQANLAAEITNLATQTFFLHTAQKSILNTHIQNFVNQLFNTTSYLSIFPALGTLENLLGTVPVNSPAFTILFGTSFSNRAQEIVASGVVPQALQEIINSTPGLSSLSTEEQTSLAQNLGSIINLALLLQASTLLSASIGSDQLLPTIASAALPPDVAGSVINQAGAYNEALVQSLTAATTENLIQQGYSYDAAIFLTGEATSLLANSAFYPQSSVVEWDRVNLKVFLGTLGAGLVVGGVDVGAAIQIAHDALQNALSDLKNEGIESIPTNQFLTNIEGQLRSQGLGSLAHEAVQNAVVLPEQFLPEPAEIFTRVLHLIVPHLGVEVANRTAAAVNQSLFGVATPTSADFSDVRSPVSLVNSIKAEVAKINKIDSEDYSNAMATSFKDSMSLSTQPVKFLEELLDPAFQMVHSINTGIMYGGNEPHDWQKAALQV